jgi:hypothetical protein
MSSRDIDVPKKCAHRDVECTREIKRRYLNTYLGPKRDKNIYALHYIGDM